MAIIATVIKRGNSLGIVLPKDIVDKQNIKPGDVLSLPVVIKKR